MKHAYLILAHADYEQLQLLVNMLDDERNDIFLHIDKKSNIPQLTVNNSRLFVINNRVDVRWGDVSGVEAELILFESAFNHGPYDYYHLLSGVDLPIKSNDYIDNYFSTLKKGTNLIGINTTHDIPMKRTYEWHFLTKYYRINNVIVLWAVRIVRKLLEVFANIFLKRKTGELCYWGPNWVSLTNDFCAYLLGHKSYILHKYRNTLCADEVFVQTLIMNSPFRDTVYSVGDLYKGCGRMIDWDRGTPYTWGRDNEDYAYLMKCDKLFARKFSLKSYPALVYQIYNNVLSDIIGRDDCVN